MFIRISRTNFVSAISLVAIFSLALFLRLYPVLVYPEQVRHGLGPFGDSHLYHRLAYNLYQGNGFSGSDDGSAYGLARTKEKMYYEPAITRGPVYPFFIASVYRLFGNERFMKNPLTWHFLWDRVRITQCVLDALVCLMIFFIVRIVYSGSVWPAYISALLYSVNGYTSFYTRALLSESLTIFMITLTTLFFLCALRYKKAFWYGASGMCCGLTALVRPEYIVYGSVLIGYVFFFSLHRKVYKWGLLSYPRQRLLFPSETSRRGRRKSPRHRRKAIFLGVSIKKSCHNVLLFLLGGIIIITPWALRNYHIFKRPIVIASSGLGYNLFVGTYETKDNWKGWGIFPKEIFSSDREREELNQIFKAYDTAMKQGSIKMLRFDAMFFRKALVRIQENTTDCFKTWIRKIPRLWYQDYIAMYQYKEPSGSFFVFYMLCACVAFILSNQTERMLFVPLVLVALYVNVLYLPLHVEPRYGLPALPGIIALAGIGVFQGSRELYYSYSNLRKQRK
jgi:hypothetical protein